MTDRTAAVTEFRVGSVLSRGFSILLKNIVPFWLLAIFVSSPPTIYALVSGAPSNVGAGEFDVIGSIMSIVSFILGYLVTAVLVYGTVRELRGNRASIGDCISGGLAVLLPVIGVAIVAAAIMIAGTILLVIPGIIAFVVLWVAVPVAVVERPGVFASLGRSVELTKGYRWQIFGLLLLLLLIGVVVVFPIAAVVGGMTAYAQSGSVAVVMMAFAESDSLAVELVKLINLVLTALIWALWAVIYAVSYHDLRVAKEGIGTEDIAAVFD